VCKLGGVDDGMSYAMKVVFEDLKRLVAPCRVLSAIDCNYQLCIEFHSAIKFHCE
jgi:hypothetical protein